jgi:UDP-N-acetylglucosamine--N-acetylmuramyl-(pentapeptide) pyrophosphoryl-undecaprenol N-acetylglucosamine transferase
MRIVLTGGGTGGHFYPIISVAEALMDLAEEQRLIMPKLIFMSDDQYDANLVSREGLIFKKIYAGKVRRYFSLLNLSDSFKTIAGIVKAIIAIYSDMPDVIFGKGGYVSFPVLCAARILQIPVVIHESDAMPGTVNHWAAKFAKRIAVSFPESAKFFPENKTALTGTPVRKSILGGLKDDALQMFELEKNIPVILVLGGSQGSQTINDNILDTIGELVEKYQIIHQCGKANINEVAGRADVILEKSVFKKRYHVFPYLDDDQMRHASCVTDLVISRAGSSAIFEIAAWGLPSIIIPLKGSAQDHQRENAFSYARAGATSVIEENNLTPHVLVSEIKIFLSDKNKLESMKQAAKNFSKPDAARKIAQEIINIGMEHVS